MGLGMLLSKNQPNQLLLAKDMAAVKQLMVGTRGAALAGICTVYSMALNANYGVVHVARWPHAMRHSPCGMCAGHHAATGGP